jgi:GT2 family glycosyltransferase
MSASTAPEISVVIPVRNGARPLGELLDSLAAQTVARDRFEVIVVDNDSGDDSAAVAAARGATVVSEPVANRARARNRGVAVASSRLYAFVDADCVASSGWLEGFLACAGKAPLVAGEVRLSTRERPNAIERFESLWRFGQEAWVRTQGWAVTANLLVHADAFEAIDGFDSGWRKGAEDVDFCLRARAAGYPLEFCGRAVVEHGAEHRLRPMLRRAFMHGYSINQAFYRLGVGYRAWRDPGPAIHGDRALRQFGQAPERFEADEWRRMARLARIDYAGRVAGSLWAETLRAR